MGKSNGSIRDFDEVDYIGIRRELDVVLVEKLPTDFKEFADDAISLEDFISQKDEMPEDINDDEVRQNLMAKQKNFKNSRKKRLKQAYVRMKKKMEKLEQE